MYTGLLTVLATVQHTQTLIFQAKMKHWNCYHSGVFSLCLAFFAELMLFGSCCGIPLMLWNGPIMHGGRGQAGL